MSLVPPDTARYNAYTVYGPIKGAYKSITLPSLSTMDVQYNVSYMTTKRGISDYEVA